MGKEDRLEKDPEGKRVINKTDLQIGKATERFLCHRDYISHTLRWTHIIKWMAKLRNREDFCVLDAGSGVEFPMLRMLYTNKIKPRYYKSLDARALNFDELHQIMTPNFEHEFEQVDFAERIPECKYGKWDAIFFLEVLEHNAKESGIKILENIKKVMNKDTYLFLSTPSFNGKAAENHTYEYFFSELKEILEGMFNIEAHYGTFASQSDIEPVMDEHELNVYERLKNYYDSNYLATIFAPNHPEASRNVIYRLKLK